MTYWLFVKTSVTVMKSTICDEFKCHSNKLFFFNILVFVFSETVLNSTTLTLHKRACTVYTCIYIPFQQKPRNIYPELFQLKQ